MEWDLALAQRAATFLFNLAVVLLVGAGAATAWLRRGASDWASGQVPRLRRTMLAWVLVAIAAHAAILWLEAAYMAEVPVAEAREAVRSVITATHYGFAWTVGAGALTIVAICSATCPAPQAAAAIEVVRAAALGVLLYSRSMVSHAGAGGDLSWALAIDWLHLVMVSIWLGEVLVAGLVTLRRPPGAKPRERVDHARYIEALSRSATVALAGIVATGAASAWRGLGSLENAVGNPYAAILLVKVGLVLAAAALGGLNRIVVMPPLLAALRKGHASDEDLHRRFGLVLRVEAVVLLAALLAAAFLSATPPPAAA